MKGMTMKAKDYYNVAVDHETKYANILEQKNIKDFHDFLVITNNTKTKAAELHRAEQQGNEIKVTELTDYLDFLVKSMKNWIEVNYLKTTTELITPTELLAKKIGNTIVGLNGHLAPTGEFFECEYGEHIEKAYLMYAHACANGLKKHRSANETPEEFIKRMGYLSMGSKGLGFEVFSHIRFEGENPLTSAQVEYLDANIQKLDENQRVYYMDYKDKRM